MKPQFKTDAVNLLETFKTFGAMQAQNDYDKIVRDKKLNYWESIALKQEFMRLYKQVN